ncbi:MAG TPA: CE1759 family FMN reductase [Microbacteriaceae bacterium]|nr:CE1759 family FMN reductase [Microbacteriaceae bacterium]
MSARRLAAVGAGLATPSSTRMLVDRLVEATLDQLQDHGIEAGADVFELRDYAHDVTDNMLAGFASPKLESMINAVVSADAVIFATPIFSTSYSGLFKSFIDVLDKEALLDIPVLLAATAGTPRHSLAIDYAMRPLFAYLHADPVSTAVFAASADWGGSGDQVATLAERIRKGATELAAKVARRDPASVSDPFDPDTYLGKGHSFGNLLGGLAGE